MKIEEPSDFPLNPKIKTKTPSSESGLVKRIQSYVSSTLERFEKVLSIGSVTLTLKRNNFGTAIGHSK